MLTRPLLRDLLQPLLRDPLDAMSFTSAVAATPAFDPAATSAFVTLSEANALMTASQSDKASKSVRSNSAGKRYFEVQMGAPGIQGGMGIALATESVDTWVGSSDKSIGLDTDSGDAYMTSGSKGATGIGVVSASDVIGIPVDLTLGKIWFSRNGAFGSGQDPVANTGGFTFTPAVMFIMVSANAGGAFRLRTLAAQFSATIPSGYAAWGAP